MGDSTVNQADRQAAKVALVTGGAKRIGLAIAFKLHSLGYRIAIHYKTPVSDLDDKIKQFNQKRANSAMAFKAELNETAQCQELITMVIKWSGRLDVLVNNASVFYSSEMGKVDDAHWDMMFATNVKAPFFLSQYAATYLKGNSGNIINITDIHGQKPLKGYAVYCMSKASLLMQTKALAREYGPDIRVNSIAPGAIIWPEFKNALSCQEKNDIVNKTPLKRHGHPDYIAHTVQYILENDFITGQSIAVDGGRSIV